MPELPDASEEQENHSAERAAELEELQPPAGRIDGIVAARSETPVVAITAARTEVAEVLHQQDLDELVTGIKDRPQAYKFSIGNSYHAEAESEDNTGKNTHSDGQLWGPGNFSYAPHYSDTSQGEPHDTWASAREQAHSTSQVVEQTGVRAVEAVAWQDNLVREPRQGLAGTVGLTKEVNRPEVVKTGETLYLFDYQFAAPATGDNEAATATGNHSGQNIELSLQISEDQARKLSQMLQEDPNVARGVVDAYIRETGDIGKWNAELSDAGNFEDPGKRYGPDFLARDVRPNYDATPGLEPEVLGLYGIDEAGAAPEQPAVAA